MATTITNECINCGACEPECPNTAIYAGGVPWELNGATSPAIAQDIYYIVPSKCTECVGFFDHEACAAVCPVDCCIPDPANVESEGVLLARARKLHPEETFADDAPSRFRKAAAAPGAEAAEPTAAAQCQRQRRRRHPSLRRQRCETLRSAPAAAEHPSQRRRRHPSPAALLRNLQWRLQQPHQPAPAAAAPCAGCRNFSAARGIRSAHVGSARHLQGLQRAVDDSVSAVRAGRGVPLPVMLGIVRAEDRDVPGGEGDLRGLLQSATGGAGGIRAQAGRATRRRSKRSRRPRWKSSSRSSRRWRIR